MSQAVRATRHRCSSHDNGMALARSSSDIQSRSVSSRTAACMSAAKVVRSNNHVLRVAASARYCGFSPASLAILPKIRLQSS